MASVTGDSSLDHDDSVIAIDKLVLVTYIFFFFLIVEEFMKSTELRSFLKSPHAQTVESVPSVHDR